MINNMKGFTLIETLLAVLLLSTAIAGPLTIASKGLNATLVAKDQFIAFYLAQDAVEQVRYLRDTACLASPGGPTGCGKDVWLASLTACKSIDGSAACYLDSTGFSPASPTACPSNVCAPLKYDPALQKYQYTTGAVAAQQFVRTIRIIHATNGPLLTDDSDEATVTVTVSWTDTAGVTHPPIKVEEHLFRWQ